MLDLQVFTVHKEQSDATFGGVVDYSRYRTYKILRESAPTSQHLVRKEGILRNPLSFGRCLHVGNLAADTRDFLFSKCLTNSLGLVS